LIIDPLWGVFARILDFSCAGERGDQRCSPPLELAAKPSQTGGMTAASSSDAIDILRIEIEYIEPEAGMIPIVCGGNISPLTTHVETRCLSVRGGIWRRSASNPIQALRGILASEVRGHTAFPIYGPIPERRKPS
jgi:hypothetical protein